MPSPWSVFIPVAAAATFAATWLLTPSPQAAPSAPASSAPAFAVKPEPVASGPATVAPLHPARPKAVRLAHAPAPRAPRVANVYYAGCNEVRAAGKAPLFQGQPGYRVGMDGDLDGIACEPHRNRW